MSILQGVYCRHCEQPAGRLMLMAMLQDAGAQTSENPLLCWALEFEGEHDFIDRTKPSPDPLCVIDGSILGEGRRPTGARGEGE